VYVISLTAVCQPTIQDRLIAFDMYKLLNSDFCRIIEKNKLVYLELITSFLIAWNECSKRCATLGIIIEQHLLL